MPDNMTSPPPSNPISSNFFTSKPFIILVLSGIVLCGGIMFFQSLSEKTVLSFGFTLDGKSLPADQAPDVKLDGQAFTSGSRIKFGKHELVVQLQNVEPYRRTFWVFIGEKDLGKLRLETSKGRLVVTVNPSPATVVVQRNGETVTQGAAPLDVETLPVGNYTLVVKRADYEETRTVDILRQQTTNEIVELNLGKVELSSIPAGAEYEMSGIGHRWQGKLPAHLENVPAGDYSLSVTRSDWKLDSDASVIRGGITTNITQFPYGSITVTSIPTGLVVSTNGVEIGKTPIILRELKPAAYNLTISDGENDLMATVNVEAKENTEHAFIFHYGTVQLMSEPTGATVIRKGREIGKTPVTLEHIPAGESAVELRLAGYSTANFAFLGVANATTNYTVNLVSERYLQAMEQAQEADNDGQFADALNFVSVALKADPNGKGATELYNSLSFKIHCQNANIYLSNNHFDEALNEVNEADELLPNSPEAAQLRKKIDTQKLERFDRMIQNAEVALSRNDIDSAASQLDDAAKLYPESPKVADLRNRMGPALRQRLWDGFRQRFSDSPYSGTATLKYSKNLAEAREETIQAVNHHMCAWKLQEESEPNRQTVFMVLAPAGLLAKIAYPRTGVLMLSQLQDGFVEMRAEFWVYPPINGNPDIARQSLEVQSENLFVNLEGTLGEPVSGQSSPLEPPSRSNSRVYY